MTVRRVLASRASKDSLNFALTNGIPRKAFTIFFGWFSQIEHPLVRVPSIALWKLFSDLDLSDAKKTRFSSLHDCFTRELRLDARPITEDPGLIVSPCDAIIGACGGIDGVSVIQAKGFPYLLPELLQNPGLAATYCGGTYVTLRLTASMYHRFHAPYACHIQRVAYIAGDAWNVNPPALHRVPQLFCKNERAVIPCELNREGIVLTLVPVAAILVASIRLHFADVLLHLRYRGPHLIDCDATFDKGDEMGWFQHGSTIIALAPPGVPLHENVITGVQIRAGQPLYRITSNRLPATRSPNARS